MDIILSNNGYQVYNLGIKQPLGNILKAMDEHSPTAVGLSGLLVKSTHVMKEMLEEMAERKIDTPIICGGAALNRSFVENDLRNSYQKERVYYGQDAFTGLKIMEELCGESNEKKITTKKRAIVSKKRLSFEEKNNRLAELKKLILPSQIEPVKRVPSPPFWGSRLVWEDELDLGTLFRFINKRTLFRFQWQYKQKNRSKIEFEKFLDTEVEKKFQKICAKVIKEELLSPRVVYGYFPCYAEGNTIFIKEKPESSEVFSFSFPRQSTAKNLCLADYIDSSPSFNDVLGMFVVTVGDQATEVCQELYESGKYEEYLYYHGLAVETAEALSEYWHKRMRQQLAISGMDGDNIKDLFHQSYQGSRYSFGYPACPALEDQDLLLKLLDAGRIGIRLSESHELIPEQSTSALVFHHPAAKYFNVI